VALASSNMMLSLVNDVLDVSRLENDKLELNITRFQLSNCVKEVVDILTF